MKRVLSSGVLVCLALWSQVAFASKNSRQGESATANPQRNETTVPLIEHALHLSDFPNMAPTAELRDQLTMVSDFIQTIPEDGNAATEATEVWIAYTKTTLYFVFICHDSHPELIREHL